MGTIIGKWICWCRFYTLYIYYIENLSKLLDLEEAKLCNSESLTF